MAVIEALSSRGNSPAAAPESAASPRAKRPQSCRRPKPRAKRAQAEWDSARARRDSTANGMLIPSPLREAPFAAKPPSPYPFLARERILFASSALTTAIAAPYMAPYGVLGALACLGLSIAVGRQGLLAFFEQDWTRSVQWSFATAVLSGLAMTYVMPASAALVLGAAAVTLAVNLVFSYVGNQMGKEKAMHVGSKQFAPFAVLVGIALLTARRGHMGPMIGATYIAASLTCTALDAIYKSGQDRATNAVPVVQIGVFGWFDAMHLRSMCAGFALTRLVV